MLCFTLTCQVRDVSHNAYDALLFWPIYHWTCTLPTPYFVHMDRWVLHFAANAHWNAVSLSLDPALANWRRWVDLIPTFYIILRQWGIMRFLAQISTSNWHTPQAQKASLLPQSLISTHFKSCCARWCSSWWLQAPLKADLKKRTDSPFPAEIPLR